MMREASSIIDSLRKVSWNLAVSPMCLHSAITATIPPRVGDRAIPAMG
jgi:hypothetical protein